MAGVDPIHSFWLTGWTSRGLTTRLHYKLLKTSVLQAFLLSM